MPTTEEEVVNAKKLLAEKNALLRKNDEKYKTINCIDASYAGGKKGLEVVQRILELFQVSIL